MATDNDKLKYATILPRSSHIQHMFDTYEQAEAWMQSTHSPGYIAIIVGEIRFNAESSAKQTKLLEYAKTLAAPPKGEGN